MHAVGRLIYRYITKNKGRTLFLGFSIMVSAALIFFLQLCFKDSVIDKDIRYSNARGGKYTCSVLTTNEEYIEYAKGVDIVNNISYWLSTLNRFNINDGEEKTELIGMADNITELVNFKLEQGRYPKNNGEIALERGLLDNMKNPPKVGDKVKLHNNNLELEYTLTGIFDYINTSSSNKGTSIAYVTLDEAKRFFKENPKKVGKMRYEFFVETPDKIRAQEIEMKLGQGGTNIDTRNLFYSNAAHDENKRSENIINIMYLIMIIAAMLTIYNILNSSIALKMPELGMLKAVGMKDSEIRLMIVGEGIVIGFLFTALGIIIGKLGYGLIIDLIGIEFLNYGTNPIPFKEIILTYVLCIGGIIISVYGSSGKILDESAIEQIRGNEYLNIGDFKRNSDKEIGENYKYFILDLAKCSIKRNKKTFKIVVASISMSIALLIVGFYCSSNLIRDKEEYYDFTIKSREAVQENQIKEELIEEIKNIDGVRSVLSEGVIPQFVSLIGDENKMDKNGLEYIKSAYSYWKVNNLESYIEEEAYYLNASISERNMDSIETLKPIIQEGDIYDREIQEEPTCILVQNYNEEKVTKYKVGDKIKIVSNMTLIPKGSELIKGEMELTISAILDEDKYAEVNPGFMLIPQVNMVVIVSDSVGEKYLKKDGYSKRYSYKNLNVKIKDSSYYEAVKVKLNDIVEEDRRLELICKNELMAEETQGIMLSTVLTYSLPIILTICSILNLFSIMSMNIVLRKKEFAMFRAVGMSDNEIKKLISIESLLYGLGGVKFGVIVGTILVAMMYMSIRDMGINLSYPFKGVITIMVCTVLISLGAAFNSWRIVLKDDIISSIRSTE